MNGMENVVLKFFLREMKWADEVLWELISYTEITICMGDISSTQLLPLHCRLKKVIHRHLPEPSTQTATLLRCILLSTAHKHTHSPSWAPMPKCPGGSGSISATTCKIAVGCICHFHCSLHIWLSTSPNHTFQSGSTNKFENLFSNREKYTKINL